MSVLSFASLVPAPTLNNETNVPKPPKCVHSITRCLVTLPIMSNVHHWTLCRVKRHTEGGIVEMLDC